MVQLIPMLQELGNALSFLLLAALLPVVILYISKFFRPSYPHSAKLTTYECGELPVGSSYIKFNNKFYLVAICFLVFDVEVAVLFPVLTLLRGAVLEGSNVAPVFLLSFGFLGILLVGLIYEWKKGDLDWIQDSSERRKVYLQEQALRESKAVVGVN